MARGIAAGGKPNAMLMRFKQKNQISLFAIEIIFWHEVRKLECTGQNQLVTYFCK